MNNDWARSLRSLADYVCILLFNMLLPGLSGFARVYIGILIVFHSKHPPRRGQLSALKKVLTKENHIFNESSSPYTTQSLNAHSINEQGKPQTT